MKLSLLVAAAAAMTASGAVTKIPMKKTPLTLKGVKEGVWHHRGVLGKLSRDYNLGGSGSVVIQTVRAEWLLSCAAEIKSSATRLMVRRC